MGRKVQFRGKRCDNGEWVYGSLMQFHAGEFNKPICCIMPWQEHDTKETLSFFEVDFDTVGQALDKKDKNNVEIYEGDIAKHDLYNYLFTVKYDHTCYVITTGAMNKHHLCEDNTEKKIAVIGNINDSPELLENA
jgi:uncharacterized phage protein (TIGR01671 family)